MQVILLSDAYAQSCDMDIIPVILPWNHAIKIPKSLLYISDTTFKGFSNTNVILTLDRIGLTAHT